MAKFSLQRLLRFVFANDRCEVGRRAQHRGKPRYHMRNRSSRSKKTDSGAFKIPPLLQSSDAVVPDFEASPLHRNQLQQDSCHGMWYEGFEGPMRNVVTNDRLENLRHHAVDVEELRAEGLELLNRLGIDVKKDQLRKEAEGLLEGLNQQLMNLKQTRSTHTSGIIETEEDNHLEDFLSEASPFILYYRHELQRLYRNIDRLSRWHGRDADGEDEDDQDDYQAFLAFYYKDVMPLVVKAGDRDHFPVSGNIYMYMALKDFGRSSGLIQTSRAAGTWRMQWVRMAGFLVIALLQILAPVAIMSYAVSPLQISIQQDGKFDWFPWFRNDPDWGVSFQSQRMLGILFLFLFVLNGLFVLRSDLEETKKMMFMCRVFEEVAEKNDDWEQPQYKWLWVGAFINVLCLLLCSICMFFLFILAAGDKGPKDIVFDSLGLAFLYNLDDIGGDLTLLDEEWDEDMIGDIYGGLADNMSVMQRLEEERVSQCTPDNIYQVGEYLALILLVALPLLFAFCNDITPIQEVDEVAELKATVQKLTEAARVYGMIQ